VVPGQLRLALQPAQVHRHAVEIRREVDQQRRHALELYPGPSHVGQQFVEPGLGGLPFRQATDPARFTVAGQRGGQFHDVSADDDEFIQHRL
jgi:hypothetical protein